MILGLLHRGLLPYQPYTPSYCYPTPYPSLSRGIMAMTLGLPMDMLSDSLLCDMPPLFGQLADLPLPSERLFFDVSPPDSPAYSTTVSDASGEEFVDMLTPEFKLDYDNSEVMWSGPGADMFMASSVTWVPESPAADELTEFSSIAGFTLDDDSLVGVDETTLFEAATAAAAKPSKKAGPAKRKASADADARPAKKARTSPAASPAVSPVASPDAAGKDDPEAKRHTHNVLERRRRNDLKNSYQQLRVQIPNLEDNERAPTGQILIHAVECIAALKAEEQRVLAELEAARAENERLRALHA